MLDDDRLMAGNGVRTVIVEDTSRFARELVTQGLSILALISRSVRVLTANSDDLLAEYPGETFFHVVRSAAQYTAIRCHVMYARSDRRISDESDSSARLIRSRTWPQPS